MAGLCDRPRAKRDRSRPNLPIETHGYDTIDYFRIDSRLGTETDFALLLTAARQRGIRVLLDGVFNHVGRTFQASQSRALQPSELVRRTGNGDSVTFGGHDKLVTLDHEDERVVDLVVDVMSHWLKRGIDGWRLDAAYAVPAQFWRRVIARVRETYPDAYFIGEYIHADYPAVVRDAHLDSVTQYELWQGIWHSIEDHNLRELDWALSRHNQFLHTFVPFTFIGNHDVTRIASQITDPRHRAHAVVLLMTLGGTPAIYYGDERGETGRKEARVGGDDEIRPAYPAAPTDFTDPPNAVYSLHRELIGLRRRHSWLEQASSRTLTLTETQYVLEIRSNAFRLYVALNIGDGPCDVHVRPKQCSPAARAARTVATGWTATDGPSSDRKTHAAARRLSARSTARGPAPHAPNTLAALPADQSSTLITIVVGWRDGSDRGATERSFSVSTNYRFSRHRRLIRSGCQRPHDSVERCVSERCLPVICLTCVQARAF
ncbi:alpha-amylase family glycosyl hydrolase [Microbacterium sp. KSW4-11]|uniref:Alpha-amylase family glycosyl hydrolase n=1 Tax=Microbacterium gawkjiense TaxID=3067309 RepID=A0ABU3GE66_9MICO|nr:alpha-amylase family glycosyl hydrolase [Microbacterium sp. KSW4-11]MDT3318100.1 alpha-amylase family glycosyl hydrolase [Microbacterium sp. KSW4-11]